ncbi:MAG TPA: TonB-dependent receptor [Steroidobacteraceae bacterium]|nr:TonB-dependent receptor [Steroidobacteraceae bacterium]
MTTTSQLRWVAATGVLVLMSAVGGTAAWADPDSNSGAVEEVIVTARRTQEELQKVPISVTALPAEALRELDVQDIAELSEHVPNLNLITSTSFGGSSTAYAFIRGIGQQDIFVQNDPGVGIYLDGVYIGRSQGAVFDVIDLQRVEVLRGPQGTLYGRNTIGGAINLVSEVPNATPSAYADVYGGNYSTLHAKAKINGPITDNLFGSLFIARLSHDGYVEAKPDPSCPNCSHDALSNEDTWAARGALRLQASDALTVDLGLDYTVRWNRSIGSRLAFYGSFPFPNSCMPPGPGPVTDAYACAVEAHWGGRTPQSFVDTSYNTHQSSYTGWDHQYARGANLTFTYSPGNYTFKSITAYRRLLVNDASDSDSSPLAQANEVGEETDQWQVSQELQLSSSSFEHHLDWITGLFAMREHADNWIIQGQQFAEMTIYPPGFPIPPPFPGGPPLILPFPFATPSACFNASQPPLFNCGLLNGTNGESTTDYRVDTLAAYGNATWHITPRWSLSAGLRFNSDYKHFVYTNASSRPPLGFDLHNTWNATPGRVGMEFQATPDALLYASWSYGFKSGTFNNGTDPAYPVTVKPETAYAYELGAKTAWFDHHLIANLAGFYTDYRDMQLQVQTNFAKQYRAWTNVGDADIYGFEFELMAKPSNVLHFVASVGNTHSKIKNVNPIALYDPLTNPFGVVSDGARLIHVPLFSTDLGAVLDLPIGSGILTFRVDWSSKSAQEGDLLNSEVARVDEYNVTNARLSYGAASGRWEVYVLSDNVFDKKYETARYSFSPTLVAGAVDGAPRTVAAGARLKF